MASEVTVTEGVFVRDDFGHPRDTRAARTALASEKSLLEVGKPPLDRQLPRRAK
jgi:hypothetical protein